MRLRFRRWTTRHKLLSALISLLIIAVAILLALELLGVTDFFKQNKIQPVIQSSTPKTTTPTTNGSQHTDKEPVSNSAAAPPASTKPPAKPSGEFVSNHHPNLDGNPAPSQESSVCNTTPGAMCYISFTKGSLTTKLPAQKADSEGAVYWTWDVKKAGLTSGEWTITAVTTLNGQSRSVQDPLALSVMP